MPSSTVGRSRSFGCRTAAAHRADAGAAECLADSLQQAMLETPAGARPAWLRSHRLDTPLSSTSTVGPFSAYRHSSRMPAAATTASEACTPPPRAASCIMPAAAPAQAPARSLMSDSGGSGELHLEQQQRLVASHIDGVALGVPMEPMMEAFTPHTSAMRLRAAMQWMRLQLGAVAVGGGAGGGAGNGASPRRMGRQRRYSDSSVSPALKILLGASAGAPPAAGGGATAAEYESSDGASEGCMALEQQLADLELDRSESIAGPGAGPAHAGSHSRASIGGGGGGAVDLLMSDEADVEADVFCLNPLFDGQQRRTEGGAPGRCIAPWQAGSPDKEVSSDSDDFGPYCGPAAGVLPFAAAAAVAGQPAASTTQSAGLGAHAVSGGFPMASVAAAACAGGGGGVLRDISHGLNLAARLAPAGKGSSRPADDVVSAPVWR
ncbi:hypothetical protein HXX76_014341 [Chlamydomonas incerta]|uniref:Uncharacterized protein n=1 Tax=Chlamydomonas incerta TaxID=51695 RepID=A0A835VTD8_CHLIN|nr:hypothetical protein HXX76_014341 [Chlamydomonas incerta]|eukprot:KAG2424616.1 hypothetical protein HXX76_014341 [Chlamydomonas incerta]